MCTSNTSHKYFLKISVLALEHLKQYLRPKQNKVKKKGVAKEVSVEHLLLVKVKLLEERMREIFKHNMRKGKNQIRQVATHLHHPLNLTCVLYTSTYSSLQVFVSNSPQQSCPLCVCTHSLSWQGKQLCQNLLLY